MTTTVLKTSFSTPRSLPTQVATSAEQSILAISTLRGWYEAGSGVDQTKGFRWQDRSGARVATLLNVVPPLAIAGSHGNGALQMSYGSGTFSGTERGALRPPSDHALIGTEEFTVFSVTRVPTVASGDSATLGGMVWCSRGPSASTSPSLNISGSTGLPTFRAGGVTISNPGGFDARTGNWHVMRCAFNKPGGQITINIDRTRATGSASGTLTSPDSAVANMLAPLFGGQLTNALPGVFSTPFYGQTSALLFFNGLLSAGEIIAVEDYLAAKYGAVLV